MSGTERRNQIVERIKKNAVPVSGTMLAKEFEVSRQVIVQDIALIRAAGYDIISTHRGYLLNEPISVNRIFKVQHTDEQTEEELYSIVDLGGTVANVIVNHKVYGQMEAEPVSYTHLRAHETGRNSKNRCVKKHICFCFF